MAKDVQFLFTNEKIEVKDDVKLETNTNYNGYWLQQIHVGLAYSVTQAIRIRNNNCKFIITSATRTNPNHNFFGGVDISVKALDPIDYHLEALTISASLPDQHRVLVEEDLCPNRYLSIYKNGKCEKMRQPATHCFTGTHLHIDASSLYKPADSQARLITPPKIQEIKFVLKNFGFTENQQKLGAIGLQHSLYLWNNLFPYQVNFEYEYQRELTQNGIYATIPYDQWRFPPPPNDIAAPLSVKYLNTISLDEFLKAETQKKIAIELVAEYAGYRIRLASLNDIGEELKRMTDDILWKDIITEKFRYLSEKNDLLAMEEYPTEFGPYENGVRNVHTLIKTELNARIEYYNEQVRHLTEIMLSNEPCVVNKKK